MNAVSNREKKQQQHTHNDIIYYFQVKWKKLIINVLFQSDLRNDRNKKKSIFIIGNFYTFFSFIIKAWPVTHENRNVFIFRFHWSHHCYSHLKIEFEFNFAAAIENKKIVERQRERVEQAKNSISTIRSRQRKTTDCLLATVLWFVPGSLAHIELRVYLCVRWYNPSRCRGLLPPLPSSSLLLPYSSFALFTTHTVRVCVVCDSRELLSKNIGCGMLCVRSSRWGDRTNQRTNKCTHRWTTKKMPISLFSLSLSFIS